MEYTNLSKRIGIKLSTRLIMKEKGYASLRLAIVLMLSQSMLASTALAAVIYVGQGAPGLSNGSSWTDAYTNLQTAITNSTSGDEIWVKAGTYIPAVASNWTNAPSDPRYYHFHLKNGVTLYGGFAGTETALIERDISANPTILSGNNTIYYIFYHDFNSSPISVNNTAVLDGFTLTDAAYKAMQLQYSAPTIRNCTFLNNTAIGSSIDARPSGTHMYVENSTFIGNSSGSRGGAIFINGYSNKKAYITNCTFKGNSALSGGAIANIYSGVVVTNSTFSGNTATNGQGHAIYSEYAYISPAPVTNSILWNENASGSEIYNVAPAAVNVTYSIVTGGYAGTENSSTDPDFDPLGLQNNGGPVQTIAILDSGSAYDSGTETGAPASDARGISRPQGEGYDRGAFEIEVSTAGESSLLILPLLNSKAVIFDF